MAKPALGKGLGALIKGNKSSEPATPSADASATPAADMQPGEKVIEAEIDNIVASPLQPRGRFNEEHLTELMESIQQHGIIQPLIVRPVGGKLELIAGERRWRASQKLGLKTVPVIERHASDQDVLEMALIENLQRQDLDPIEEAAGYVRLAKEFTMKQDEIAKRVGKNRASVANAMRLLDLAPDIQKYVAERQLTVGHGKAILGIKDHKEQIAAAEHILKKGLNVRAAERFVKEYNGTTTTKKKSGAHKVDPLDAQVAAHFADIQNKLRDHFATHVNLVHGAKKGRVEIEYYGDDDLQRLLDVIGINLD